MKIFTCIFGLLSLLSFQAESQKTFDLKIEGQVRDSLLVLDLKIKNITGKNFALGSSNFDFKAFSSGLDAEKTRFVVGEFDATSNPESYSQMGFGQNAFYVMNVRANSAGVGNGKMVDNQETKIGSIEIPITNPCATVSPEWVVGNAAIHSFFKTAKGEEITSQANYITPAPIDLDGGVSKSIPSISFANGKLVSSSETNNQWYLDGTLIPGAISKELIPLVQGKYSVEVTYPCAKNTSAIFPVTITGLADIQLAMSYSAKPNPFIGEAVIAYTLQNEADVKLELYDMSGTHIVDLSSGRKAQGVHEFVFKPSFYNLSAGTYVAKLTVGEKIGTLKLVAQK